MIILSHWLEWYQINVKKWIFLKAEKAKTTINSHHAQVLNKNKYLLYKKNLIFYLIGYLCNQMSSAS